MLRASSQGLCLPLPAVCGRPITLLAQATCQRMGMASQPMRTASSGHHHHGRHQHIVSQAQRENDNHGRGRELEKSGLAPEPIIGSPQKPMKCQGNGGENSTTQPTPPPRDTSITPSPIIGRLTPPVPPPVDLPVITRKNRSSRRRIHAMDKCSTTVVPGSGIFTRSQQPPKTENEFDFARRNSVARPVAPRRVYLRQVHPRNVFPVSPAQQSSPGSGAEGNERLRNFFLFVLSTSPFSDKCWNAYSRLLELQETPQHHSLTEDWNKGPPIPFALLHRLCRVIAAERPAQRKTFIRLHSILTVLHAAGGDIHLHEWNALIHSMGRGTRRRLSSVDYETALSFYMDMLSGFPPGTTLNKSRYGQALGYTDHRRASPVKPDIYTYTSLIHLAARTADNKSFQHACSLLEKSGTLPNRITHLSLIPFFRATKHFSGLRSTLWKMEAQKLDIGIDGLNAFLSSYAHNGRLDVVMNIYRLLRFNIAPAEDNREKVQEVAKILEQEEYIQVPTVLKPNQVTYTAVVQSLAYQGRLKAMLTVMRDMASSPNLDNGHLPLRPDERGILQPVTYQPTMAIYRSVFMGFARYGVSPGGSELGTRRHHAEPEWNRQNLQTMFGMFMQTPNMRPTPWVIYWILVGFKKTTDGDTAVLRLVWKKLEKRFGAGSFGSTARRKYLSEHFLLALSPST